MSYCVCGVRTLCPIKFRGSGHFYPNTSVFSVHQCVFRFFINFSMSLHLKKFIPAKHKSKLKLLSNFNYKLPKPKWRDFEDSLVAASLSCSIVLKYSTLGIRCF